MKSRGYDWKRQRKDAGFLHSKELQMFGNSLKE